MSSALAMVLTAAMAVPGNGPEKVSGEVEQGLDLRGEWEGTWRNPGWPGEADDLIYLSGTKFSISVKGSPFISFYHTIVDEGDNKLRFSEGLAGIYRQDGGRITICLRAADKGRPTDFQAGNGQHLITLHRVKPRK
jgi:hypothetical protein